MEKTNFNQPNQPYQQNQRDPRLSSQVEDIYYDPKFSNRLQSSETMKSRPSNVLSEKRQVLQSRTDFLNSSTKYFEGKENISPEQNELDYCEVCVEDLVQGEIVNYCQCGKFYHPNCLIYSLTKNSVWNNSSTSGKLCEDCGSIFQFANYKQSNQMDSTIEKTLRSDNTSLIDTNINNLENYNEMRDKAFQMSSEELMDIIFKRGDSSCNEEIGRIALSPIVLTTTPYSGKTKGQIPSSNQKPEVYSRLQNTHTTPNNYRHINLSEVSEVINSGNPNINNYDHYQQSPDLHGIRQHLSFGSPNAQYVPQSFNNNLVTGVNQFSNGNFNLNHNIQGSYSNMMNVVNMPHMSTNGNYNSNNLGQTGINGMSGTSGMSGMNSNHPLNLQQPHSNIERSRERSEKLSHFMYYSKGSKWNKTEKENCNLDVDKFLKSVNFDGGFSNTNNTSTLNNLNSSYATINNNFNNLNSSAPNQISFRKIVFDDIEEDTQNLTLQLNNFPYLEINATNEDCTDKSDKENSPPVPRFSSKFSYNDPETIQSVSPVEINLEVGCSHVVSDSQKTVEVPITVDFRLKENFQQWQMFNFSRDFIVIFNTLSLNIQNVYQIFKIIFEKINDQDRFFTNILRFDKWLSKEELRDLISNEKFSNFINTDTQYLNFNEITTLMTYCIDLSFELHSNIFSIFLINDIDDIPQNVDHFEELKIVSNKLKESRVNLIKNFSINCILLDHGKSEEKTPGNVKSISYFYEMSIISMGYFFSPKDVSELYKSVIVGVSLFEQACLLNVKANIVGNQDPSVYIEVANYPHSKNQHNHFEIFLGNLMKKERKFLNLSAIVILNAQNVSMNLPLLEINLEFMTLKQRESIINNMSHTKINSLNKSTHYPSNNNASLFNLHSNFFSLNGNGNLVKNKTSSYQISIPILNKNKEVIMSNSVVLRACCAKIGDILCQSLECLKYLNFEESLAKLYDCKSLFEQIFRSQTGMIKYIKLFSDLNTSSSINLNMNNVHFLKSANPNTSNISNLNNSISIDDSINDIVKSINSSNISKIFSFCFLILSDINSLIEMVSSRNLNLVTEFFTIKQSLMFYRPVHLTDERFLEDVIDLN